MESENVKSGCTEYFNAMVPVHFEKNHIGCAWCPCLQTYSRKQCNVTAEFIIDDRTIGNWCPFHDKAAEYLLSKKANFESEDK